MIFTAPNGLCYDAAIHDFIEADGTLASAQRVAETWGMIVEEVEQDRQKLADAQQKKAMQSQASK